MTSEIKIDDDDPPLVLQNCSAMSRQAAMSPTKTQKPKRGWGLGWLGAGINQNIDKSKSGRTASVAMHQRKTEKFDSSISSHKVDKSLLPTATSSVSSSSIQVSMKSTEKKADKNATMTYSRSSEQETHIKSVSHPPSPKSLSPRDPSSNLNQGIARTEASSEQMSTTETTKNVDANGISNGGVLPDELSRHKRREEIRQKTAWYEEYIRDHLSKHNGDLSSLNKEDLVAMGLFDKQRRLNRRLRLWGDGDPEAEQGLSDEELEQLLILAEKCNQAQNDEAELEMLLVQMENNNEVDTDRLYHLELLSRQRMGGILNPEELDALHIFEGKKQDKDDLESLRRMQKSGTRDVDQKLLRELTLLERKRNGDETMTSAELRSAAIIEMRHEDVRLNKLDYKRLLRLKEQGIHVDEDRFNLLRLLDHRHNGVKMTEPEAKMLEHYFELREEEYMMRYETKMIANAEMYDDKSVPVSVDNVESSEGAVLQRSSQNYTPDNDDEIKEGISDASIEKSGDDKKEIQLPEPTSVHQLQCNDDVMGNEFIDDKKAKESRTNSEVEGNNEMNVAPTFDAEPISNSDKEALEKFQLDLKKEGLPSLVSFIPNGEDEELNMSTVSFGDLTYINDILLQKETRESDRKEECLEDAYKIYKRKIKKQKLPESEAMLLAIFSKTLQQRNAEMRDEDIKFNKLVEKVESLYKMRQEEAKSQSIENAVLNYIEGGQSESKTPKSEKSMEPNVREATEKKKDHQSVSEEKKTVKSITDTVTNATDERKEANNDSPQSASKQLETTVGETEIKADESRLSQQFTKEKIKLDDETLVSLEKEGQTRITHEEVMLQEEMKAQSIATMTSVNQRSESERLNDEEDVLESKESDSARKYGSRIVRNNTNGEEKTPDKFSPLQDNLGETHADSIDQSPVGKAVKQYLRANQNGADESIPFENLPFEVMDEEDKSKDEESHNSRDTKIEESAIGREVVAKTKNVPMDAQDESLPISCKQESKDESSSQERESVLEKEISDVLKPDIDGRGEIKLDLLYELNLVTRLRKGLHLTDKQDYELDLLQAVRRGHRLSTEENEDLELLRSERGQITLNDTYMSNLYFRSSRNEPVNDDLLYEIELFHKPLGGEFMSDDEKMELYLFERRLNGDLLEDDDLEVLEFLKRERLELLAIAQPSSVTENLSVDEESNEYSASRPFDREIELLSSGESSESTADSPLQTFGQRELSVEDEDSLYRRDLLGRQMAGQRLDKKEFQWLQILVKKSRNEELDDNDLEELELMRSQRNEEEVNIVNTKKLLEKELRRQNKIKMKEKRRKEKEVRREQRRKEKHEREQLKKRRRRKRRIISSQMGETCNSQIDNKSKTDASYSRHGQTEVQIIGAPSLPPPRLEETKKDETKMGVFGAVFKNAQKQRQEQQLEEARRLQEELIREQMKALALENEAEELEREKVMQEQLVQETIEKKRATSTSGSSFHSSIGSSSWGSSLAEESSDDSDSSSWTSWDTSSDDDSSNVEEVNKIQQMEKVGGEKTYRRASNQSAELSQLSRKEVEGEISAVYRNAGESLKVLSSTNRELSHTNTDDGSGSIPINNQDEIQTELASNHGTSSQKASGVDQRQILRSSMKGSAQRSSLGTHLKKRKKKRTKHGDDVSLGTMQLAKVAKEGRDSQNTVNHLGKSKDRPWAVNDNIDNTIDEGNDETSQNGDEGDQDEKSANEASALDFDTSFVSKTSEKDGEEEQKSLPVVHSDTVDEEDTDAEEKASVFDAHSAVGNSYRSGSLANSYRSIGEEKYDLGLDEYDNIESRLGGKVKEKQAEFDLTWETAVADEDVVIQINKRLRERQREMEAKREKKKKKEKNQKKEAPRLFLFEGEKIAKRSKKKSARRKHERNAKSKLNRTFTQEFRKAMKEVFASESYSDDEYSYQIGMSETRQMKDKIVAPPFSQKDFVEGGSDHQVYSDADDEFAEDFVNNAIDESVKFDGDYLKRLQERSLPADMKKMLSGRSMNSKMNLVDSPDNPSSSLVDRRRPRRKKTGEIVNPNIDPADIYALELAKQKEEKAFSIAGIRKEMEEMRRSKDFIDEGNTNFGNFDVMSPSLMSPSPLIQTNVSVRKIKKKVSLGKGVESLERQRPKLPGMRSMRSLGTTTSDQGLLTGNRRKLQDANGETGTSNIEGGIEKGGRRAVPRTSSDSFGVSGSENEKSDKNGGNGILTNMNLFGAIKKTFKQKPVQFESVDGGGLLNSAHFEECDTSESKGGGITDDSYARSAFTRQEPLPLPPVYEQDDEMQQHRTNKMFQKVKIKGAIKKLKKLPGKSSHHRKFNGGIMMAD